MCWLVLAFLSRPRLDFNITNHFFLLVALFFLVWVKFYWHLYSLLQYLTNDYKFHYLLNIELHNIRICVNWAITVHTNILRKHSWFTSIYIEFYDETVGATAMLIPESTDCDVFWVPTNFPHSVWLVLDQIAYHHHELMNQ